MYELFILDRPRILMMSCTIQYNYSHVQKDESNLKVVFFPRHQTSPVFRLCLLYIRYVGFTKSYKKNRFFLFFGQIYLTLYMKPHKNSPNAR